MKENNNQHENYHQQHNHCCCCCCCCYNSQEQPETTHTDTLTEDIPPWLSPPAPAPINMDSMCSCCSCISLVEETKKEEEEPSIGHTTPIEIKPDIEKTRKKKLHAIEELLQTERDYVQDLCHLVEVCFEVLNRQQWIPNEHKTIITRNANEILAFHKQFIFHYDISSTNPSSIATSFIDQMSQFTYYKHYCDMHAEAWTLASEYRDRPEWSHFTKDCIILDSYSIPLNLNHLMLNDQPYQPRKLHFEDYLIKPVQRICRYQLLIKEILKYTPPQTAEFDLWSIVLNEIQDIVTDIDNRKFQRDMKERTDKFIDRLEGDWRISKRHVSQLGNLLIAGAIEVTYSALGQTVSKPRYLGCFVFQTYVIMVRPKKVTSYEPKHWFPLRMTEFEDLIDIEGQMEHSFVLRCKKHAFAFSASCSQEKQLWVKKIQEAIVAAKIEASDDDLSAQDYIVSSLPGITSKRSPQSIRLSKSFTNLLDMTLAANELVDKKSSSSISAAENRSFLRRSASTSIQFDEIMKITMQHPPLPASKTLMNLSSPRDTSNLVTLKKRYSADYSAFATRQQQLQHQLGLKPRNNSEMYIKPDSFGSGLTRRRPSSLDLLSAANNTSNMIGKMSSQFKNNHQNALRVTVDHKLRDVCTQEYLSSRAWHMRDREASNSYYQLNAAITSEPSPLGAVDLLKKRKSTSFIRSSASSFSIIIPKRESKVSNLTPRYHSEYELQSNVSSCSSSVDRSTTPVNSNTSRRPSQSSQLMRRISQNNHYISESPISFDHSSSVSSFHTPDKRMERSPSRKSIFVGKVLRRIASFHPISSSPTSFSSSNDTIQTDEVQKAATLGVKKNKMGWRIKQEEVTQLEINDRPNLKEINNNDDDDDDNDDENDKKDMIPVITAFAFASTPPATITPHHKTVPRKGSLQNINRTWKNKFNSIKRSSFLRVNSTSNFSLDNNNRNSQIL